MLCVYLIYKIRDNPGMDRIAYPSGQAINNANRDENKNMGNTLLAIVLFVAARIENHVFATL